MPDIYELCLEAFSNTIKDLDFLRIRKEQFSKCPNISIDKGIGKNKSRCCCCTNE